MGWQDSYLLCTSYTTSGGGLHFGAPNFMRHKLRYDQQKMTRMILYEEQKWKREDFSIGMRVVFKYSKAHQVAETILELT